MGISDFQVFGNIQEEIFFLRTNDFQRAADTISGMIKPDLHMANNKNRFFKMMTRLCESADESLLLKCIDDAFEGLDFRFVTSVNFAEFLNYCRNLVMNAEYIELKKILTEKVNKGVSETIRKANVIDMHSLKKAI